MVATSSQYQASGDYEGIIEFIKTNVSDVNSDPEIKKIYDDSVIKYKEIVIKKADEHVAAGDYSSAASVITTAIRIIGEDSDLSAGIVVITAVISDFVLMQSIFATIFGITSMVKLKTTKPCGKEFMEFRYC